MLFVDDDDQILDIPTTSTPTQDEREDQPRRSRRRLNRSPPASNEPQMSLNQSRRIRFILPAQLPPPTQPITSINAESSARAILTIARDTIAHHLDTGILRDAVGLEQQVEPRHILTRNQPISMQQSTIISRPNLRRPRGESYNSIHSARDELYNMTNIMQREVIPSILDGENL